MEDLKAIRAVAAEFGLGVVIVTTGSAWKLTLIDNQGPLVAASMDDLNELCRAAVIWLREEYVLALQETDG